MKRVDKNTSPKAAFGEKSRPKTSATLRGSADRIKRFMEEEGHLKIGEGVPPHISKTAPLRISQIVQHSETVQQAFSKKVVNG